MGNSEQCQFDFPKGRIQCYNHHTHGIQRHIFAKESKAGIYSLFEVIKVLVKQPIKHCLQPTNSTVAKKMIYLASGAYIFFQEYAFFLELREKTVLLFK